MAESNEITTLLAAWREGDKAALDRLIPIVYQELRRLASHHMRREQDGHTLQTTALVHEAYLRLSGEQSREWQDRAHFFGVAAHIMRNLLVDRARASRRVKRGGNAQHVTLDDTATLATPDPEILLVIDEALVRLAQFDERASRVVELRYFGGLSVEEAAVVLGVSEKTIKRDWSLARTWLQAELRGAKLL